MVPSHEVNPIELSKLWYRTVSGPVHPHGLFQIILPAKSNKTCAQNVTLSDKKHESVILSMTFERIF